MSASPESSPPPPPAPSSSQGLTSVPPPPQTHMTPAMIGSMLAAEPPSYAVSQQTPSPYARTADLYTPSSSYATNPPPPPCDLTSTCHLSSPLSLWPDQGWIIVLCKSAESVARPGIICDFVYIHVARPVLVINIPRSVARSQDIISSELTFLIFSPDPGDGRD